MSPQIEPSQAAVWEGLFRTVAALMRVFESELLEAEGLSLSWYDVLVLLHYAPDGRLRLWELADGVVLTRSGITRLLDRMEKEGLLRREASQEDRRGAYAVLTEKGLEVTLRADRAHSRSIQQHFGQHLTEDDLRALSGAVGKVREALRLSSTPSGQAEKDILR